MCSAINILQFWQVTQSFDSGKPLTNKDNIQVITIFNVDVFWVISPYLSSTISDFEILLYMYFVLPPYFLLLTRSHVAQAALKG